MTTDIARTGQLAFLYCKKRLPLQVLQTRAGFYIGTFDEDGPCSRESLEYFPSSTAAETALRDSSWTQREHP